MNITHLIHPWMKHSMNDQRYKDETPFGEFNGVKRQGKRLVVEEFPSVSYSVLQMGKYDDNFVEEGQELQYAMAEEDTAVVDGAIGAANQYYEMKTIIKVHVFIMWLANLCPNCFILAKQSISSEQLACAKQKQTACSQGYAIIENCAPILPVPEIIRSSQHSATVYWPRYQMNGL